MLLLLVTTPILLLIASQLGLFPWSGINCTTEDVDIYSGRIRHSRYLMFIPIQRSVEDSTLTKALLPEDIANARTEWHQALTFSPGLRHSPYYVFHTAISQIDELNKVWHMAQFTADARRASAKRLLQLWQQSGSVAGAREYLQAISELALPKERPGR